MTLDEYMRDRFTDQALAEHLGVDRSFVHKLRSGARRPSIRIAAKIETWTGGKVKAATFAQSEAA